MVKTFVATSPKMVSQVVHWDLGDYSQDTVTLVQDTGIYKVGEVIGEVTASGKFEKYDDASALGPQIAVAVVREETDTAGADALKVPVEMRVATLLLEGLEFDAGQDQAAQDAAIVDLEAAGFKIQLGIG